MAEGENRLLPFVFWPLDIMHTWIDKCNNFLITWKLFPCRWIALFSWQHLLCHLLVANFFLTVRSLLSFSRGFPWLSWEERKEGYYWSDRQGYWCVPCFFGSPPCPLTAMVFPVQAFRDAHFPALKNGWDPKVCFLQTLMLSLILYSFLVSLPFKYLRLLIPKPSIVQWGQVNNSD